MRIMHILDIGLDCIGIIASFCAWIDRKQLAATCMDAAEAVGDLNIAMRQIMLKRLARFVVDPSVLLDSIDKFGCIISGSFMVSCMYEPDWVSDDLDLYVNGKQIWLQYKERNNAPDYTKPADDAHPVIKHIITNRIGFVECLGAPTSPFDTIDVKTIVPTTHFKPVIKEERIIGKIQFITVLEQDMTIMSYIARQFDMNICKIAYMGGKVRIYDEPALLSRSCVCCRDLARDKLFMKTYRRYDGDDIYDIEFHFYRITERIDKYRKRGFDITYGYDYELDNGAELRRALNELHELQRWLEIFSNA
jgi:hypothetical protein